MILTLLFSFFNNYFHVPPPPLVTLISPTLAAHLMVLTYLIFDHIMPVPLKENERSAVSYRICHLLLLPDEAKWVSDFTRGCGARWHQSWAQCYWNIFCTCLHFLKSYWVICYCSNILHYMRGVFFIFVWWRVWRYTSRSHTLWIKPDERHTYRKLF